MAESEFRVLVDIAPVQALSENITLHMVYENLILP